MKGSSICDEKDEYAMVDCQHLRTFWQTECENDGRKELSQTVVSSLEKQVSTQTTTNKAI